LVSRIVRSILLIPYRRKMGMAKEILRMEDVTKIYDNGFVANKNVTFWLHESEILALVGENGAGKTTLMKVLFGLETPQTGKVYMDGKEVKILNTLDAIEKGIGMVHQHFMLIPSLTVAENVVLGVEPMKNGLFDFKKAVEMTEEVAKKYNFNMIQWPGSAIFPSARCRRSRA